MVFPLPPRRPFFAILGMCGPGGPPGLERGLPSARAMNRHAPLMGWGGGVRCWSIGFGGFDDGLEHRLHEPRPAPDRINPRMPSEDGTVILDGEKISALHPRWGWGPL